MSEHIQQTIATLQAELRQQIDAVNDTKRVINNLCKRIGQPPIYSDSEQSADTGIASIRRDQWYGQPLATAIREYMLMRRASNQGPATVGEIYESLTRGGFAFDAKDPDNAKRNIRISLTKNTALFHRLPDGNVFGLAEWYPDAKPRRPVPASPDVIQTTEEKGGDEL